jgi:hypothetical protein
VLAGNLSTRCGLNVSGPAAALSESLEHPEQTKIPPSCTIQLPRSAVVTFSLLRPQSEHLPFAGSCCVTRPMVPTSAPVNGGWWEVAPQAIHDARTPESHVGTSACSDANLPGLSIHFRPKR